jgi:putative nucleotidyltransferase with HDIG domain
MTDVAKSENSELRILMLEDEAMDTELIQRELQKGGIHFVSKIVHTEKAFREEIHRFSPTLILSDFSLPSFDGLSALAIAKKERPHAPFIFVSGTMGEEVAIETLKNGATDYVLKHRLSRLVPSVQRALREMKERTERQHAEEKITKLNIDLEHSHKELILTYDATLEGWSRALDLRDKGTEGHSLRVRELTVRLARQMGFSEEDLVHIGRGALLHDIGKMGIPDSILLKPGPLTSEEMAIMRLHPDYAQEMLSPIVYLRPALEIPYCHHEKWDGTGYPRGLKGTKIPLAVRIFSVVDVWDALRSDRPYHDAWPVEKVREHIRSLAGTHFDPDVVDAVLKMDI